MLAVGSVRSRRAHVLLLAERGRGKSSCLGIAAGELAKHGKKVALFNYSVRPPQQILDSWRQLRKLDAVLLPQFCFFEKYFMRSSANRVRGNAHEIIFEKKYVCFRAGLLRGERVELVSGSCRVDWCTCGCAAVEGSAKCFSGFAGIKK